MIIHVGGSFINCTGSWDTIKGHGHRDSTCSGGGKKTAYTSFTTKMDKRRSPDFPKNPTARLFTLASPLDGGAGGDGVTMESFIEWNVGTRKIDKGACFSDEEKWVEKVTFRPVLFNPRPKPSTNFVVDTKMERIKANTNAKGSRMLMLPTHQRDGWWRRFRSKKRSHPYVRTYVLGKLKFQVEWSLWTSDENSILGQLC